MTSGPSDVETYRRADDLLIVRQVVGSQTNYVYCWR